MASRHIRHWLGATCALLASQSAWASVSMEHIVEDGRYEASAEFKHLVNGVNHPVKSDTGSLHNLRHVIPTYIGFVDDGKLIPLQSEFGSTKLHADWIYGFSAFWDPLREEVRFLFDSLEEKARNIDRVLLKRYGASNRVTGAVELHGCRLDMISDPGGREDQHREEYRLEGDIVNFLEGWQLTCSGVRHHFQQGFLLFDLFNGTKFTSFRIKVIETERVGKIAACVGPLYTQRQITKPFVHYNVRLGIDQFDIYHALVSNLSLANPYWMGVWPSAELSQHHPLSFFLHDRVMWYSYEAPPLRYYYGQTTALNDCVIRNRYSYDFVVISDPDELVRIVDGPSMDLSALLDNHFPSHVASLAISRYLFPMQCCERQLMVEAQDNVDPSVDFFDSCKLHIMKDHDLGKSIVRPNLIEAVSQHTTILYRNNVKEQISYLDPNIAYVMHIKSDSAWDIPMNCDLGHIGFSSD